jgi:hypothetical protein
MNKTVNGKSRFFCKMKRVLAKISMKLDFLNYFNGERRDTVYMYHFNGFYLFIEKVTLLTKYAYGRI